MKIAVTGANGYIGSHLVKELLNKGHQVTALDIHTAHIPAQANIMAGNIFSDTFCFPQGIECLIHLAWVGGFDHSSLGHLTSIVPHFQFLRKAAEHGIKRLVVLGTMHELGYFEGKALESSPCNPMSYYGIAKNTLRQALQVYAQTQPGLNLQWIRAFYITGDDFSNHSIFSKILQLEQKGAKSFPFTDGKNQYDFQDIYTLCGQITAVAEADALPCGIINCCSGKPVAIKDKVEEFIRRHHLNIRPEFGKFPSRPYDSPCIYGDNSKILRIMEKAGK